MRITVSHNRTRQEVVDSINRSFDELFSAGLPVKVAVQQKEWQGSTLHFALTAKMGMLSTPIKGTVEVTDHDLTVDADLGMLNNFISEKSAQDMIGTRIKGLLK
jgi:Putative polyhydroxyalkanoic acid system protein (PHA_gran_rgn)